MAENKIEIDMDKVRRETTRWLIMVALNSGRPIGCTESMILPALQSSVPGTTEHEMRREMEYLEDRGMIEIEGRGLQPEWHAKLTHHGIDVVEYTVECYPGIGRPPKYW